MADEPQPCDGKARIDAEANHGIGDIDTLLATYLHPEELQLGLQEIKQHLQAITMDNHKHE